MDKGVLKFKESEQFGRTFIERSDKVFRLTHRNGAGQEEIYLLRWEDIEDVALDSNQVNAEYESGLHILLKNGKEIILDDMPEQNAEKLELFATVKFFADSDETNKKSISIAGYLFLAGIIAAIIYKEWIA